MTWRQESYDAKASLVEKSWNWVWSWFEEIHRHGKWNIYILTGSSFSTTSFHPSSFFAVMHYTLVLFENDKLFSTNPQFFISFQDNFLWKIVSCFFVSTRKCAQCAHTLPASVSTISETDSKSHVFRFILMHYFWSRKRVCRVVYLLLLKNLLLKVNPCYDVICIYWCHLSTFFTKSLQHYYILFLYILR